MEIEFEIFSSFSIEINFFSIDNKHDLSVVVDFGSLDDCYGVVFTL